LKSAVAGLEEAKAQREQLYLDWKRNINLKTGQALAARDYEAAEFSFKAMARHVEKMQEDVAQARADRNTAKWNFDNCEVKAPVSGTILTKKAEKGNIVNPIAFNISTSLCEMADLKDLEVDLSIQERDIALISKGQLCRVRPEAYKDRVYEGVVSRLMPIADRAKGAIPVRVKLKVPPEEEGVYLKPDMGVIVSFLKK
jgi:multidrug resistance efflux pump